MPQMDQTQGEIFIVDDDPLVRDALSVVFTLAGYKVRAFADGASFVAAARAEVPACIILDVHMPGRSGLDILRALNAEHYPTPIFIISGQGDIPMAVEAIRNGALDFIEKPFNGETVVTRVREAIEARTRRSEAGGLEALAAQFPGRDLLTPREREVLGKIAEGASNKEAGRLLGISPRTIEVHRARIMEKLGAKNAADLVRIVLSEGRR
ncbi:MAG TPA: response regulator [Xanthobacteraceae bacterium]|jgi:two-component system, LuxR family, response regulator FixJ|nr:response regulator [Xanthobacteraceae bacterium]